MTVRVGVIGVGAIGQDHVRRLTQAVVGAEVVAVADVDHARAATLAEAMHGVRVLRDGLELIRSDDIDGVVVASWGPTHEEFVLACVAERKPVMCEKPLAPDIAGCLRILDAESAGGRRLVQVGFMRRYDPAYLALKDALATASLGAPLLAHCAHRNAGVPPHYTGGMPISDTAIHEFDIMPWLLDQDIVAARVLKPRKTSRVTGHYDDPLVVILQMSAGTIVDVEVFVTLPYGYDIRCEVVCELGTVALPDSGAVVLRRDGARSEGVPLDFQDRFRSAYQAELQAWVNSIHTGEQSGASAWDGYAATAVAEACLDALDSGECVRVRKRQRPALYASSALRAGVV